MMSDRVWVCFLLSLGTVRRLEQIRFMFEIPSGGALTACACMGTLQRSLEALIKANRHGFLLRQQKDRELWSNLFLFKQGYMP